MPLASDTSRERGDHHLKLMYIFWDCDYLLLMGEMVALSVFQYSNCWQFLKLSSPLSFIFPSDLLNCDSDKISFLDIFEFSYPQLE